MAMLYYESSFAHHGIKGQKWGVRRFQNPDGTLTKAGERRRDYYDKKYRHGSDHAITGLVYEQHGMYKMADREYKKADAQRERWKNKRDELDTYTSDKHIKESIDKDAKEKRDYTQKLPYGSQLPDNKVTRKADNYLYDMRYELRRSGGKIPQHDFDDIRKGLQELDNTIETLRNIEWANSMQTDAKTWIDKSKSVKLSEINEFYKHHGPGSEGAPKTKAEKEKELGYWDEATYNQYKTATKFLDSNGGYNSASKRLERDIDDQIYLIDSKTSRIGFKRPSQERSLDNWKNPDLRNKR